jgi:hypothetical protein
MEREKAKLEKEQMAILKEQKKKELQETLEKMNQKKTNNKRKK